MSKSNVTYMHHRPFCFRLERAEDGASQKVSVAILSDKDTHYVKSVARKITDGRAKAGGYFVVSDNPNESRDRYGRMRNAALIGVGPGYTEDQAADLYEAFMAVVHSPDMFPMY